MTFRIGFWPERALTDSRYPPRMHADAQDRSRAQTFALGWTSGRYPARSRSTTDDGVTTVTSASSIAEVGAPQLSKAHGRTAPAHFKKGVWSMASKVPSGRSRRPLKRPCWPKMARHRRTDTNGAHKAPQGKVIHYPKWMR